MKPIMTRLEPFGTYLKPQLAKTKVELEKRVGNMVEGGNLPVLDGMKMKWFKHES